MKHIEDSRGSRVALRRLPPAGQNDRLRRLRQLRLWLAVPGTVRGLGLIVGMAYGAAFILSLPFLLRWTPEGWFVQAILGWYALLLAAMVFTLFRLPRGVDRARIRLVAGEVGMCLGCGYDLQELHAQEDGCTVCPECGAAWRLAASREPRARRRGRGHDGSA